MADKTGIDPLELAYLAGMIDADGYITATASKHKRWWYFGAQVGITGSRREPHDLAASIFGGNVNAHQPGSDRAHHKVQYHWQRCGRTAVPVIEALLPHLRVKTEVAHLVLALQQQVDEERGDRNDPYPHMPAGYDPVPSLLVAVQEIRELHARRGSAHPEAVA